MQQNNWIPGRGNWFHTVKLDPLLLTMQMPSVYEQKTAEETRVKLMNRFWLVEHVNCHWVFIYFLIFLVYIFQANNQIS
jgi:hypothetical protein